MNKPENMTPEEVREKIKKIKEGIKKEKCYFCPDDFKEEVGRFYAEIDGELRLVHRRCWRLYKAGGVNIRLIVR